MTATVVDLASRRAQSRATVTCPACQRSSAHEPVRECYPHRLASLAARLRLLSTTSERELLIPAPTVLEALADATGVLDGITAECLPLDERNTP